MVNLMIDDEKEQITLNRLLSNLASADPTPGGGSVAALAGALGASLLCMVAKISLKKKEIGDGLTKRFEDIIAASEASATTFSRLINDDAEAYDAVLVAHRLPKGTDSEKNERGNAIESAFKHAAEVPLETMEVAKNLLDSARFLAESGNINALTDTAVAVSMLASAVHGARLNVEVNLKYIKDIDFNTDAIKKLRLFQNEADALISEANSIVIDRFQ